MTQPMVYVIAHSSSTVVRDCIHSLDTHGWKFELFPAIDGRRLGSVDWERIGVKMSIIAGKLPKRAGAQGCWFSHWSLWEQAVKQQQPMVILEHDAVVTAPWPDDIDIDSCIVRLYTTSSCKTKPGLGTWSKGAHAYTVTPQQAQQLIDRGRTFGASPVDKHIISEHIPWRFLGYDLVTLNSKYSVSSTSRTI